MAERSIDIVVKARDEASAALQQTAENTSRSLTNMQDSARDSIYGMRILGSVAEMSGLRIQGLGAMAGMAARVIRQSGAIAATGWQGLLGPIALATMAITAVVAIVRHLSAAQEKAREMGQKAWEGIRKAAQEHEDWMSGHRARMLTLAGKGTEAEAEKQQQDFEKRERDIVESAKARTRAIVQPTGKEEWHEEEALAKKHANSLERINSNMNVELRALRDERAAWEKKEGEDAAAKERAVQDKRWETLASGARAMEDLRLTAHEKELRDTAAHWDKIVAQYRERGLDQSAVVMERAKQEALAQVRDEYAQKIQQEHEEAAAKEMEVQQEIADANRQLADEVEGARIQAMMKGSAQRLALLDMEERQALERAQKEGLDLELVRQKFAYQREMEQREEAAPSRAGPVAAMEARFLREVPAATDDPMRQLVDQGKKQQELLERVARATEQEARNKLEEATL